MFDKKTTITPFFSQVVEFEPIFFPDHWIRDGIIVRTPNWLGDLVMILPALKQLKKILPEFCALAALCPQGLLPILEATDLLEVSVPLKNAHAFPSRQEWKKLGSFHAGAGVLMNNSLRDAIAMKLAHIPNLIGMSARGRDILLKRAFRFPKRQDRVLNEPHQATKYLSMVYAMGAPVWDGVMPEFHLSPESTKNDALQAVIQTGKKLLTLAPGAAYGDAKRWDPGRFRTVAEAWLDSGGVVACVGATSERDIAGETLRDLPETRVFNLAGQTSLLELMETIRHSKALVANDSGTMHLAAAIGTPGVAIFGSTDPSATAPLSLNWRMLYTHPPCGPCFKRDCPDGTRRCFESIRPDDAIAALHELLVF